MLDLLETRQEAQARSSKVESTKVQQESQKVTAVKQAWRKPAQIVSYFLANNPQFFFKFHNLAEYIRDNLEQLTEQVKKAQSEVRNAREEKLVQTSCQVRMGGVRFVYICIAQMLLVPSSSSPFKYNCSLK